MCKEARILGYHTNHSLRATAATHLHQSNSVEEQEIMERTGHRSIEAVRSYKRPSTPQLEQVSDIPCNGHTTKSPCYALAELDHSISVPPHLPLNRPSLSPQVNSVSLNYASASANPVFNLSTCASKTRSSSDSNYTLDRSYSQHNIIYHITIHCTNNYTFKLPSRNKNTRHELGVYM